MLNVKQSEQERRIDQVFQKNKVDKDLISSEEVTNLLKEVKL
jgi:hypothetical protein